MKGAVTMAYDTKAIANYFLELANVDGVPVSSMKLNKLLFFAHGWHLAIAGEPLLDEDIEAWKYGPTVSSIYHEFKEFGNLPITTFARNSKRGGQADADFPLVPEGPEHELVRQVVRKVWETYHSYTGMQLSSITHQDGTPWSTVVKRHSGSLPYHAGINNDLIKEYFVHLATKSAESR